MLIEFNPFASQPYIDLPFQVSSWIGLFVLAGFLVWGFTRWSEFSVSSPLQQWGLTIFFIVSTPLTLAFLNFYLPTEVSLRIPNLPIEAGQPLVFLLFALPWVLAGGMAGPTSGVTNAFSYAVCRSCNALLCVEAHCSFDTQQTGL